MNLHPLIEEFGLSGLTEVRLSKFGGECDGVGVRIWRFWGSFDDRSRCLACKLQQSPGWGWELQKRQKQRRQRQRQRQRQQQHRNSGAIFTTVCCGGDGTCCCRLSSSSSSKARKLRVLDGPIRVNPFRVSELNHLFANRVSGH